MEAFPCVADAGGQQGFDIHVNILIVGGKLNFPRLHVCQNLLQAPGDGLRVLPGDDAAVRQHDGMGYGSGDVLPVQPLVKGDGGIKVVHKGVGVLSKPPGPQFHGNCSLN